MRITESQLRFIVRQELLEVLNENNANLLDEGVMDTIKQKARKFGAAAMVGGALAGALGGAANQSSQTMGGTPDPVANIAYTVAAPTDAEMKQISVQVDGLKDKIKRQGNVHSYNEFKYDKSTKVLTYRGSTTKITPEVESLISEFMKQDTSDSSKYSSSARDTWMASKNGQKLKEAVTQIINTNEDLKQAVGASTKETYYLMLALMLLVIGMPVAVASSEEPNKRRI